MEAQPFTWSSGITTGVRALSPLLRDRIEQAVRQNTPKPQPKKVPVTWVDGTEGEEDFINDPDYQDQLVAYEREVGLATARHFTNFALLHAVEVDAVEVNAALAELDASLALFGVGGDESITGVTGEPLPAEAQRRLRYIREVCFTSGDDWPRFLRVLHRTIVDEEAIQGAAATFRR
jgi:hypothetical protein